MDLVRYDPKRVLAVTAGLSVGGAVCGAVAGATAIGIGLVVTEGARALGDFGVLSIAAAIGATVGAVLAPVGAWGLLRRVPIGRAFAGLTIGTIIGGVVGWLVPDFAGFYQPVYVGGLGFLAAGVLMRQLHSGPPASSEDAP